MACHEEEDNDRADVGQRQLPSNRQRAQVLNHREAGWVLGVVVLVGVVELVIELIDIFSSGKHGVLVKKGSPRRKPIDWPLSGVYCLFQR